MRIPLKSFVDFNRASVLMDGGFRADLRHPAFMEAVAAQTTVIPEPRQTTNSIKGRAPTQAQPSLGGNIGTVDIDWPYFN